MVKIACVAQLVNVIAPLITRPDGLLVQTIYWPLLWFARHARGVNLRPIVTGPTFRAGTRGDVPAVDVATTYDGSCQTMTWFVINRDRSRPHDLVLSCEDHNLASVEHAVCLSGPNLKAVNSWESPEHVRPAPLQVDCIDGELRLRLSNAGLAVVSATMRKRG